MSIEDSSKDPNGAGSPPPAPLADEPIALEDRLANPTDRLAASVADFILVTPIATLAMSPFHRMAEEAQLKGSDDQWFIATASAIGIALLIAVAYQTLFLMKWRATPGKRLFGLTVESLWQNEGDQMRAQSAFLRSFAFCLEAALLGLPWIAVIGNERRRPFHDRLADTIVLSKKPNRVGPPRLAEMSLASGLISAVFTSALIVLVMRVYVNPHGSLAASEADGAESVACEAVDRAEKSWVEGLNEKKPSRMSIALALYEGEAIDEECLKQEADVALWKAGEKDLSYLARGLAEKSDDELSQAYLTKACTGEKQTDACRALVFLNASDTPEDQLEAKAAQTERDNEVLGMVRALTAKSEPFLKVLAIRELTSRHLYAQALAMVESFSPQRDLSFFLESERMKTLWALGRKPEARLAMKSSVSGFDSDQRVSMSRWFCQQETSERGCTDEARTSCDLLASHVEHDKVLLGDPEVTLAYMRGETCAGRLNEEKLSELKNEMPDANSQSYVEALIALSKGEQAPLRGIASRQDDAGGPFVTEAQLKLVDLAKNERDLTAIREMWADGDSNDDAWVTLGRHLMDRYNQLNAWDQTIEIGFKLSEGEPLDQQAARSFIVAAYRSGQTKLALGYLETYFGQAQDLRLPASVHDDFDEIANDIRTDMDNGVVQRKPTRKPNSIGLPLKLPAKRKHK